MLIGLPGSGKSTRAKEIVKNLNEGIDYAVHSTDSYFMINGVYNFDFKKLGYHHRLNQEAFKKSVEAGIACVICDNTNIRAKDRKDYVLTAQANGYKINYEIVGEFTEEFAAICAERNTHDVPLESVLRMAKRIQLPELED